MNGKCYFLRVLVGSWGFNPIDHQYELHKFSNFSSSSTTNGTRLSRQKLRTLRSESSNDESYRGVSEGHETFKKQVYTLTEATFIFTD